MQVKERKFKTKKKRGRGMQQVSDGALSESGKPEHQTLIEINTVSPPTLLPCLFSVCTRRIECDYYKMSTDEVANVIVAHEDGEVGKQSWRFPNL
jgi:hypothetical protein